MTAPDDPAYLWEFRGEDFVYGRLAEQNAAAEALPPGAGRDQAMHQVDCLYLIAAEHNIWVDNRGQSAGHCITCELIHGTPCATMCRLARLWSTHPDYVHRWNEHYDSNRNDPLPSKTDLRIRARITIRQERQAELDAFGARFDLVDGRDGEYWECRSCGAEGEHVNDRLGRQHCTSIGAAPHQHPQCPPDPDGPWAWTIRTPIAAKEG